LPAWIASSSGQRRAISSPPRDQVLDRQLREFGPQLLVSAPVVALGLDLDVEDVTNLILDAYLGGFCRFRYRCCTRLARRAAGGRVGRPRRPPQQQRQAGAMRLPGEVIVMASWTPAGVGRRIAAYRTQRGMTQAVFAGLMGKSVSWVRQVEQGTLHVDKLSLIIDAADILHCEIKDLIGLRMGIIAGKADLPQAAAAMRAAVMTWALPDQEPVPVDDLRHRVAEAWGVWHGSRRSYTDVGRILPLLLLDARHAHQVGDDPRAAAAVLSNAYHLARLWLKKVGDYDLATLCSDRSAALAREADDPVMLALSAWSLTGTLNAAGHPEEGEHVANEAIRVLAGLIPDGPARLLGLYGQLHLVRAISQARSGQEGAAWGSWDEADRVARRVGPDFVEPVTCFCAANVAVHTVAIPAELGQAGRTIEAAERLDISGLPSVERRARYCIDVARGYVGKRDDVAAVHMLLRAERESPEELLYSGICAEILRELLVRNHAAVRDELRELSTRVGVLG
jgi:transcriptional regulator with XRE-family HTH domain